MADNSISIMVNHSGLPSGNTGGGTTGEAISRDYINHLNDLTKQIADLNNHFKNTTSANAQTSMRDSDRAYSEKTAKKINTKELDTLSDQALVDLVRALDKSTKSQETGTSNLTKLMGAAAILPIGAALGQLMGAYTQGKYLTARNDLSNPVGYGQAQAENEYNEKGAWYKGIGALIGGYIGGAGTLGAGAAFGSGIGYNVGDYFNSFLHKGELGETQLSYQQSQTQTQLERSNSTGKTLSELYQKAFAEPGKSGILASQFPNMGGVNAYRGNLSGNDLTGVASFNKRYGLEGEQSGQSSVLLAQISGYLGSMDGTLREIDNYQSQYGGDTIQQLSALNSFLQAGATPNEALNAAYTSGYKGQGFQNAQAEYYQSDIATRTVQELLSNANGFSASRVHRGVGNASDLRAVHNLQADYTEGLHAEGSDILNKFLSNTIAEKTGVRGMFTNNDMPTSRGVGSYRKFSLSKGEAQSVRDKVDYGLNENEDVSLNENIANSLYSMGYNYNRMPHEHGSIVEKGMLNQLHHAEHKTKDPQLIAKIQALIAEMQKLNNNISKANR